MDTTSLGSSRGRRSLAVTLLTGAVALTTTTSTALAEDYATPVPPVDTPPTMLLRVDAVRAPSGEPRSLRVPLVVDEPVRLDVTARSRAGVTRSISFARQAGRTVLRIPVTRTAAVVRSFDRGRAIPVYVQVVATDADGEQDVLADRIRVLRPRHYIPTTTMLSPMPGHAITSGFGPRWGRLHAGVDIPAPVGTPIRAVRAGVVTSVGSEGGYGTSTTIDHGQYSSFYAHQASTYVHPGQHVERGQVIGTVGMTGSTTGAHLHYEVHVGGSPRDPRRWLA